MKKIILVVCVILGCFQMAIAQNKKQAKVEQAVNRLIAAMISGDRAALNDCVSDNLSYGHSGGHVEGKEEFVEKIASGKSDFVSIDIKDQTIAVHGNTAIVRHSLEAVTNDNNKPGNVKLKVLLVFKKENGNWKMLARQAVHPS
jgi:ketosteroid isomerase-like protein